MELKTAFAGTLESGDIMIQLLPNDKGGLQIDLESTVAYQFGNQIKEVIT
ncbi:MAG: citrate lyase ACP, partial [Prevotella sp.]|nr:citrate lyase ACP [Prevotella sp.]